MVSPVLFYHQDHPEMVAATHWVIASAWIMCTNMLVPSPPKRPRANSSARAA